MFSLGLDANNAHVQPNGAYHYHGIPTALLARLSAGQPAMTLLGWAADGFPIYGPWGRDSARDPASGLRVLKSGYQLKKGTRPRQPRPARWHLRRNLRRGFRVSGRQRRSR